MKKFSKRLIFSLTLGLAILLAASIQISTVSPTMAQEGTSAQNERPFQLPFAEPSGPDTWLVAQPYGNTTGAYRQRFTTYGLSGGIHFGLDLSAPCGTEAVAIADGIVFAVDGPFGSPPHNLMIDHPQLGYASMYGHLLEPPDLRPGERVKQGQVVALTGDSAETCYGRPHLHLEIRDLNHVRKYNPMTLIEANWNNLVLIGNSGRDFARDLAEPRKWQSLYDQPEARTGGPIINDFASVWPLDWSKQEESSAVTPASLNEAASSPPETSAETPLAVLSIGRQITAGECCTQPYWNSNSTEVRFIDQPSLDDPLGVWGVNIDQSETEPELVTEQLARYSPDGKLMAYPNRDKGVTIIERLADGRRWEVDTQEESVNFTPNSQNIVWTTADEDAPRDSREETIWLANTDGSNARAVFKARRTDLVTWLSGDELLMTRRIAGTSDRELFILSLPTGRQTDLMTGPQMRGLTLNPDNRYLVYYVTFEPDTTRNGIWLLDLQNPAQAPKKLPFFGTYRWRDSERLIYIPLELDATEHNFFEYNLSTGQTHSLFSSGTNLTVANNDWQVSPDGNKIALVAANGTDLNGIWVLDIK